MKRFLSIVSLFILTLVLAACGGGDESTSNGGNDGNGAEGENLRVALVFSGNLGDRSFNDSANAGAMLAVEDFGVEIRTLEGTTPQEWEANLVAVAEEGYDLIIGTSSNIADFIEQHAPNYPDQNFAVIDTVVDLPNVASISFAQNQGSFLAGAAAAMFTEKTEIEGVNEEAVIGWVGGMDIPVLHDFFIGYEQGAKYINPDITILQSFAGTWNDPLRGKELTLAQFEQGADVVMNVASGTGAGVLEGAAEAGRFAIGVDLDQDNEQPGHILTSMLKRVDNAVYYIIQSAVEERFEGGTAVYLTLAEGGVSLTDFSVMREHLGDLFPEEIVERINDIEQRILSGEIVVENFPGFGPNE